MEIINKKDMQFYIKKIAIEKNGYVYALRQNGSLSINGGFDSCGFLVYQNNYWYGRKFNRIGASCHAPERGRILFGASDKRFFEMKDDGNVEYTKLTQPLIPNSPIFLFTEHRYGMRLVIVDGAKSSVPYFLMGPKDFNTANMMATLVIALVRQYDSDGADQMEQFWFSKENDERDECPYDWLNADISNMGEDTGFYWL